MKTKALAITWLLFSSVCITSCDKNNEGKLEAIEKQVNKIALNSTNVEPIYKLYPTRNMWNFLKLDTRNGKISIDLCQYVDTTDYELEYETSNYEEGRKIFVEFAKEHGITYKKSQTKIKRAYEALKAKL